MMEQTRILPTPHGRSRLLGMKAKVGGSERKQRSRQLKLSGGLPGWIRIPFQKTTMRSEAMAFSQRFLGTELGIRTSTVQSQPTQRDAKFFPVSLAFSTFHLGLICQSSCLFVSRGKRRKKQGCICHPWNAISAGHFPNLFCFDWYILLTFNYRPSSTWWNFHLKNKQTNKQFFKKPWKSSCSQSFLHNTFQLPGEWG